MTWSSNVSLARWAPMLGGVAAAAMLAGCAAKAPQSAAYSYAYPGQSPRVASYRAAVPRQQVQLRPERYVEDDGLPTQMDPWLDPKRPVVDDPTEPFSPNYGRVAASDAAGVRDGSVDAVPADLPPAFRKRLQQPVAGRYERVYR